MTHPYQNIWGNPKIGEDCNIAAFVEIGRDVIIGDRVTIGAFAFIPPGVTIEDFVFIAPGVHFANDDRPPSYGKHWKKTLVRRGARIGMDCTIRAGVTIGEKALIGQKSNVLEDVPAGETWVGNPARKLEKLEDSQPKQDSRLLDGLDSYHY